jgi:hypothetical protein
MLFAALAALIAAPAAVPHGGVTYYRSTPQRIVPALGDIFVEVRGGDDQLWLDNETGKSLVVLGYEGEPYLRFEGSGVFRNRNSPATYLNKDRYARVTLPKDIGAKLAPDWEKIETGHTFAWHDHRTHWMSKIGPKPVREAPEKPYHVNDWTVPLRVDGKPYRLLGSLDYLGVNPRSGSGFPLKLLLIGIFGALGITAAILSVIQRRRPSP